MIRDPVALGGVMGSALHVLDARQFTLEWLEQELFVTASRLQARPAAVLPDTLRGKRLFYLFYEASTRTRVSFEAAMDLLGGSVSGIDNTDQHLHGERLEDRIRVLNEYPYDFILLRCRQEGGAQRAAAVSRVPIINAGDGRGQHPTQALLDTYTIWRELGQLSDLRVALVGDLSYERSTHSLAYVLGRCPGLTLYLVAPKLLGMQREVRDYLSAQQVNVHEVDDLRSVARGLDVVYLTKAHSDRLEHARRFDRQPGGYVVNADILAELPSHAIVLHPLPRGDELPAELDADPRIACFRQAGNGLFVRMALLSWLAQRGA